MSCAGAGAAASAARAAPIAIVIILFIGCLQGCGCNASRDRNTMRLPRPRQFGAAATLPPRYAKERGVKTILKRWGFVADIFTDRRLVFMLLLGFSSGLPFLLVFS